MIKDIEILYIDDELNNLFGFKANFRYSYVVHTASSTVQAEEILIKNRVLISITSHMVVAGIYNYLLLPSVLTLQSASNPAGPGSLSSGSV